MLKTKNQKQNNKKPPLCVISKSVCFQIPTPNFGPSVLLFGSNKRIPKETFHPGEIQPGGEMMEPLLLHQQMEKLRGEKKKTPKLLGRFRLDEKLEFSPWQRTGPHSWLDNSHPPHCAE